MNVTLTVGGDFINTGGSFLSNIHQVEQNDPPDPLPPKPGLFLGRDNLLHDITTKLGNNRHVALVGPGGIGKTSIAKVVPHDSNIIEKFGDQRFYVKFDGIDFSQATHHIFFERMAKALGVKGSEKHPDVLVRKYLADPSKKKFLVLDNVETFLHASDPLITPAIAELADMESVTFLLTTRTRDIPFTSRLDTIEVPPLDEEAAYAMFSKTYNDTGDCPSVPKALISTLQFHPLSIILLAQVAKQNQWTPTELVANWEEHQIRLLSGGGGKNNNLKITIELSLDSPSILKLAGNARHFLGAIAFLPQGVDKKKLKDLFPTVVAVGLLADTLHSHSLLYLEGEKITMLAPIRLYLTAKDNADSPLLTDVRAYYYRQLKYFGDVCDKEKEADKDKEDDKDKEGASTWIKSEDLNVERLIARDLGEHENIRTSSEACVQFIALLILHKLRPTTLYSLVKKLPHPQHKPNLYTKLRLRYQPAFRKEHPLMSKGNCFLSLASLAEALHQTNMGLNLYNEAKELFLLARDGDMVTECMRNMADIYAYLGDFAAAGDLAKKVLSKCKNSDTRAALNITLGKVAMFTGNLVASRQFLVEAEQYYRRVGKTDAMNNVFNLRGFTELYYGDYPAARGCFNQIEKDIYSLVALSDVYWREGNISEAIKLLDDAEKEAKTDFESGYSMAERAALASNQDDFNLGRELVKKSAKKLTLQDNSENYELATCYYIAGRNELYANELEEARNFFLDANAMFVKLGDIRFRARCERALGEIALLQDDSQGADSRFEKVRSLCKEMHISEELLYICLSFYFLKDSFEGWKLYQAKHNYFEPKSRR